MKNLKILLALALMSVLLVSCGDKEEVIVEDAEVELEVVADDETATYVVEEEETEEELDVMDKAEQEYEEQELPDDFEDPRARRGGLRR